jgi:hypothetical protein
VRCLCGGAHAISVRHGRSPLVVVLAPSEPSGDHRSLDLRDRGGEGAARGEMILPQTLLAGDPLSVDRGSSLEEVGAVNAGATTN